MKIQVNFKTPEYVSQDIVVPDTLKINFKMSKIFIDAEDFQRLGEDLNLEFQIPKQVPAAEYEIANALAEVAESSTSTFSLVTLLVCFALGYGLKFLWNSVNIIQFMIFMVLWSFSLPLIAMKFILSLKMLALFEFIPTTEILAWLGLSCD